MKLTITLGLLCLTACSAGQLPSTEVSADSSGRLKVMNQPIAIDTTDVTGQAASAIADPNAVHASGLLCTLLCFTPGLSLIGTIAPPVVNAQTLQASDVTVNGSKVYVAYNTAGAAQAGGLDVIDVGLFGVPSLKSSTTFADTDVNKVFVDAAGAKLYLTGNTSAGATGAILNRIGLDAAGLPTAAKESKILRSAADATIPAYAGTSVVKSGAYVYALSGSNGGLSILNAGDLSDKAFDVVPDARDLSLGTAGKVLVVSGQTAGTSARVSAFAPITGASLTDPSEISFTGAVADGAKSTITAGATGFIATGGQAGTKFICNDGKSVGGMPVPVIAGVDAADVAANAAAFGNGLVYVAQGAAGVYIYSVESGLLNFAGCDGYKLSFVGKFALSGRASANNVYYSGGYLVVATGYGGFQIIQVTQSVISGLLSLL